MTLSLLLLFAPRVARTLSDVLNRSIDIDKKLSLLDKDITTDNMIYGHSVLVGVCLAAGSLFALFFFFYKFEASVLARVFFGSHNPALSGDIIFQVVGWIGKLGCLLGLMAGVGLIVAPRRVRAIDQKMNTRYDTRSWIENLQRPTRSLDTVFFRHPILSGLLCGSISSMLIVLSILNLLR
ncbi:MAG: hypothetical protein ACM3KE_13745 [Hyphomicrobiales bacterium]